MGTGRDEWGWLLAVVAQLPPTLGVPSPALSAPSAVSLPQLRYKIGDGDYILLTATPTGINGTWAGAGRMNEESRVLLLCDHRLCCMMLFIYEGPPPHHLPRGAAEDTHGCQKQGT